MILIITFQEQDEVRELISYFSLNISAFLLTHIHLALKAASYTSITCVEYKCY